MQKIKAIIVDDHEIFREGVKLLFAGDSEIEIVDDTPSPSELSSKIEMQKPDIILLDIDLPKASGIEITQQILSKSHHPKIIMLTADKSEFSITSAVKAGAMGYLHKDTSKDEMRNAIISVYHGNEFFGSSVSNSVSRGFSNRIRNANSPASNATISLSDREIEIIKMISDGNTYKEIGEILFISPRTVEAHKNNILNKLKIKSVSELIRFAIKQNYINP